MSFKIAKVSYVETQRSGRVDDTSSESKQVVPNRLTSLGPGTRPECGTPLIEKRG